MKYLVIKVRASLALAGTLCLYTAPALSSEDSSRTAQGSSDFSLLVSTDSEQTLGRHYHVTRYLNQECEKPKRNAKLLRKKYAKNRHQFKTLSIAANELFLFQVDYKEERRNSERACSASIGFTPEPNQSYRALFEVSGQVSRCKLKLLDVTDGELEVSTQITPQIMCTRRGANGNNNGVPTHSLIEKY